MESKPKKFSFEREGLLQNHELYTYLLKTSVYPREPEILRELRETSASKHERAHIGTSPDTGRFISLLLQVANAKKTIEVGVFTGYSLLLTALALPEDGLVIGIDIDRKAYEEIGLPFVKRSGVEHKIQFVESAALPALDNLLDTEANSDEDSGFDFAFVDADKINYNNYHEGLLKLIKVGGVILYDNTLWGGNVVRPDDEPDVFSEYTRPNNCRKHVIQFNQALAADPRVDISQIPLGDGVTLCRRLY